MLKVLLLSRKTKVPTDDEVCFYTSCRGGFQQRTFVVKSDKPPNADYDPVKHSLARHLSII